MHSVLVYIFLIKPPIRGGEFGKLSIGFVCSQYESIWLIQLKFAIFSTLSITNDFTYLVQPILFELHV